MIEAGVIGKPDPVAGEIVKAYVSLRTGYPAGDDLRRELIGFARTHLGAAVAPRETAFDQHLPKKRRVIGEKEKRHGRRARHLDVIART